MKNYFAYLLFIVFISCINSCTLEVKKDNNNETASNNKIRNNIEIKEAGLHAQQAFLLKDDGSLIDDNNKIQVGERVSLRLIIDGWKEDNGKVFPEASEKIATSTGIVFLDQPELFSASIPDGTSLENAKFLTLYATITKLEKLYDYFLVSFKVWDKTTNKSLSGSYKLYI
jgi:hypothetical protein